MEQSFSVIEWGRAPVKHFSTSKVKASKVIICQSTITQRPPRPNVGPEGTGAHTHAPCMQSHHACYGKLFITRLFISER